MDWLDNLLRPGPPTPKSEADALAESLKGQVGMNLLRDIVLIPFLEDLRRYVELRRKDGYTKELLDTELISWGLTPSLVTDFTAESFPRELQAAGGLLANIGRQAQTVRRIRQEARRQATAAARSGAARSRRRSS